MKSLLFLFALTTSNLVFSQEIEIRVKEMVESKNYVFVAETVTPARGRFRNLSAGYDLVVTPDTITSYLPYFGRAFVAPINPSEGGIKFTSTQFAYEVVARKKNRWEIEIEPKDANDVRQVFVTIFDNGRASVRVTSLNRQTISFDGYVIEGREREKKAF